MVACSNKDLMLISSVSSVTCINLNVLFVAYIFVLVGCVVTIFFDVYTCEGHLSSS